jgi:CubicO group peptidase (beta-lactamase class C family)
MRPKDLGGRFYRKGYIAASEADFGDIAMLEAGGPALGRVDAVIDAAIAQKRLVGAVVLIAHDGRIVHRRAAGLANRDTRTQMSVERIFRLSSLTKPIVTAAAVALAERGKLSLDDGVTKWLPDFRPKLPDGRTPAITLRQLLTHTAGLGYGFGEAADGPYHQAHVSDGMDESPVSLEKNMRRLASVPLLFEPGASWNYSLGIDVVGAVMERAGDAPLADVVSQRVTGPLGMSDTAFYCREPSRLAVPYVDGKPEPTVMTDPAIVMLGPGAGIRYSPSRALNPHAYASGGTGMVGTAEDFLHFLEALRKGGAPILERRSVQGMMTNLIGMLPTLLGPGTGFGLGFAIITDPQAAQTPQSSGTLTWGGVYGHNWFVDPQRRLAVVSLTNTALEGMNGAFPSALRDAIYS